MKMEDQKGVITPPLGLLTKLSIPQTSSQPRNVQQSRPSSSSSSLTSLFQSSTPPSTSGGGMFLSPPITPVSAAKSPPSRNDIFSQDWSPVCIGRTATSTPPPAASKPRLQGLGPPSTGFDSDFDVWDMEARKRRSGARTWGSGARTSRSSTPTQIDDTGIRVDFTQFLGKGLTSVVYAATIPTYGIVAAKIPCNEESRKVLGREGAVLRYLHSQTAAREFIIPYFGTFEFDDTFALCFELCPQTMQEYITSTGKVGEVIVPVVGLDMWKSWLETLLSAMDFLHDTGILHNDIKPHNILLAASLHPYLSDFAVSSPLYNIGLPSPPDIHILGTTVFTAPELLSAEDVPTSPESDIYSLGITMFVAATGLEPFSWTRSVTQKIMLKKRGDIFAGTETRMPARLMEITKGMCTSDPSRRWDSSRVRTALRHL